MTRGAVAGVALLAAFGAAAAEPSAPGADPEFDAIVSASRAKNRDESCARMLAWVDAHRDDRLAPRGLIWVAQVERAAREPARARAVLERVRREFDDRPWNLQAIQGLAELDEGAHRFQPAREGFAILAAQSDPLWQFIGQTGVERVRGEAQRFWLCLGVLVSALGLICARLIRGGGPAMLWPVPVELLWFAPLLVLLALAGFGQEADEAHAVWMLALGMTAIVWFDGAWFRARTPSSALARLARGSTSLLQVAGLLFCALVVNDLWFKLIDTIAMGAGSE